MAETKTRSRKQAKTSNKTSSEVKESLTELPKTESSEQEVAPKVSESGVYVPAPAPAPPTTFAYESPEGFAPLPQDFLIYSPDHCDGRSILCLPVDVIDLPRSQSSIKALVCLLLEPTLVVDAMGHVVEARAGQEVLVECGHFIRRLIRAAMDPKSVGEVWMRPSGKMSSEGGDTITLWDIRYGKTFPRDQIRRR